MQPIRLIEEFEPELVSAPGSINPFIHWPNLSKSALKLPFSIRLDSKINTIMQSNGMNPIGIIGIMLV